VLVVTSVLPTCAASRTVKKDDVLLKIDGIVVGNDGTVPFRKRTSFPGSATAVAMN